MSARSLIARIILFGLAAAGLWLAYDAGATTAVVNGRSCPALTVYEQRNGTVVVAACATVYACGLASGVSYGLLVPYANDVVSASPCSVDRVFADPFDGIQHALSAEVTHGVGPCLLLSAEHYRPQPETFGCGLRRI